MAEERVRAQVPHSLAEDSERRLAQRASLFSLVWLDDEDSGHVAGGWTGAALVNKPEVTPLCEPSRPVPQRACPSRARSLRSCARVVVARVTRDEFVQPQQDEREKGDPGPSGRCPEERASLSCRAGGRRSERRGEERRAAAARRGRRRGDGGRCPARGRARERRGGREEHRRQHARVWRRGRDVVRQRRRALASQSRGPCSHPPLVVGAHTSTMCACSSGAAQGDSWQLVSASCSKTESTASSSPAPPGATSPCSWGPRCALSSFSEYRSSKRQALKVREVRSGLSECALTHGHVGPQHETS